MTEPAVQPTAPPETGVPPEAVAFDQGGATGGVSQDQVQEMIAQALERQNEAHRAELDQLRADQAAAVRGVTGAVPLPPHGAGVGDTVAETWSLHDQQLAMAGEHPDQQ